MIDNLLQISGRKEQFVDPPDEPWDYFVGHSVDEDVPENGVVCGLKNCPDRYKLHRHKYSATYYQPLTRDYTKYPTYEHAITVSCDEAGYGVF